MPTPDQPPAYLDHAATTPVLPEVVEAMAGQLARTGNPQSLHGSGRAARRVLEESRERIAAAVGARPGDVLLTSGGTESDNLALKGSFWARRAQDPRRRRMLTSAVEHHAVLDPLEWLAGQEGAEVTLLPVDADGRLEVEALREALAADPGTVAAVSVMWANNEVGTLQPLAEVVEAADRAGVPVHTDAVQALGAVPVDVGTLGVDALTLTGHKLGGPPGAGALVARRDLALTALLHGGGQERGLRSGTPDVASVLGLAIAVEAAVKAQAEHRTRVSGLRDDLVRRVREVVPDARLNGPAEDRLPGHAHLTFPGCEGDSLLMLLDHDGVECSTGSACSAGVPQPSHVLLAMGRTEREARGSLRFSLGRTSTAADVDRLVQALGPAVARARAAGW